MTTRKKPDEPRGVTLFDLKFYRCGRCGGDHDGLIAYPFARPPRGWSHFAACPTNGQPILVRVKDRTQR